jgi:hypothetical protein
VEKTVTKNNSIIFPYFMARPDFGGTSGGGGKKFR